MNYEKRLRRFKVGAIIEVISNGRRVKVHKISEREYVEVTSGTPQATPRIGFSSGPGTELTAILTWLGFKPAAACGCKARANQMNRYGALWCVKNIVPLTKFMVVQARTATRPKWCLRGLWHLGAFFLILFASIKSKLK